MFGLVRGMGTKEQPYLIETERQLRQFAHSVTEFCDYRGQYLQLAGNLVLTEPWMPVGGGHSAFRGQFDGAGHTISNLTIGTVHQPYLDDTGVEAIGYFGFFGVLEEAVVAHLKLEVSIHVQGGQSLYVAGLAGYLAHSDIYGVEVTGNITGRTTHSRANIFVGGIGGSGYRQQIRHCKSSANLRVESLEGMAEAGGIIGMQNRGLIANCSTQGTIQGSSNPRKNSGPAVGGIAGIHAGTMRNCYSTTAIMTDCSSPYVGALVGWATGISDTLESCYCLSAYLVTDDRSSYRQEICPAIPIGWTVANGVNRVGEPYGGCVVSGLQGFETEQLCEAMALKMWA